MGILLGGFKRRITGTFRYVKIKNTYRSIFLLLHFFEKFQKVPQK